MSVGKVREFDIKNGNWTAYIDRVEMYFVANKIKVDFKLPTLIAFIGEEKRPEERFRLLRLDSDETSIYNNIFDRCVLRPNELENLSLAEFAVRFEIVSNTTWSEDNGDAELRDEDIIEALDLISHKFSLKNTDSYQG
ncbi:unnamed protein product [Euphydryas editha]|uniref:Uncharacterized protein n=1 Tax=Euphydryas editha TaxID=104508 RepID=A0AAU9TWC5_EUPED|nr:unnamed protein product [Euphydryas editha]